MSLKLLSAEFANLTAGWGSTHTPDRQVFSILFDNLAVHSAAGDNDPTPQVLTLDGLVRCEGSGWVAVQVRGDAFSSNVHGWAHAKAWANGRPLRAEAAVLGEPLWASVVAPVPEGGELRLSLLLLAQRDLREANSAASCWLDSIDILVLERKIRRRA